MALLGTSHQTLGNNSPRLGGVVWGPRMRVSGSTATAKAPPPGGGPFGGRGATGRRGDGESYLWAGCRSSSSQSADSWRRVCSSVSATRPAPRCRQPQTAW